MILCQLVLLSHLMVTCVSISFVSTPGLIRHKTGENALFSWTLDTKPEAFGEITITYDTITIVKLLTDGSVASDPKYRGRASLTASDKTITLTLKAINRDDVIHGAYSLFGAFVIGNYLECITDNSASIYLFGKPTKPVISGATDTKEGEDLILSCTSSGTSVPAQYQLPLRYTWKRNNINLTMSLPERHRITNNRLIITYVIRDDRSHQYSCIAKEDGGLASASDRLVLPVLYPPGHASVFISGTEPLIEGENPAIDITCSVDDPGYPQARFRWSKDGQIQSGGESGTINIRQRSASVSKHDGTWKCTPSNSEGDGTSAIISVIVDAKASLSPALPKTLTVVADPKDSFNVICGFTSKPSAIVSWTYNDGVLPPGVSTQPVPRTSSGKKSTVAQKLLWNPDSDASSRRSAGGRYLCSGSVDLGKGRQDTKQSQMVLNVEYAPYEITFNSSDTLTVVAGVDRIAVACNAICKPSCGYQWQKTHGNDMRNSKTLILSPVHKVDHGSYVCLASNKHNTGGIRKVFTLNVNFAPQIISFLPSTSSEIIQNDRLTITCEVSSRPKSTITITSNVTSDIILSVSDSDKALYTFDSVHVLDSGVYHCTASNGIKPEIKVTKQLILDVKGGYRFCNTPSAEEGKALNSNVTLLLCLSANPFLEVTASNWTFKPNMQQLVRHLPGDVTVLKKNSSHPYKKYVILMIKKISESHYGTYRLKLKNKYNDEKSEYVFRLLPEETYETGIPVYVIVGSVIGVLLAAGVIIIIVLWRKRIIITDRAEQSTHHGLIHERETNKNELTFSNSVNDLENDEISPYGSSSTGMPLTPVLIQEKNGSSTDVIAKVSVFPPETNDSVSGENIPMYAQVIKKKNQERTRERAHNMKGKKSLKESCSNTTQKTKSGVNIIGKDSQDGAYSEVEIPRLKTGHEGTKVECHYYNTERESEPKSVGVNSVAYADLQIIGKPPDDPDLIHGKENLVQYVNIDFKSFKK